MKVLSALAAVLSALLVPNVSHGAGQTPPFRTAIMEMRVVDERGDSRSEGTSKLWIDFEEEKYCVDTQMTGPGGKTTHYVTIQAQGHVHVLNVLAKTAQQISPDVRTSHVLEWKALPDFIRFDGMKVGTDTVAGLPADVYEYVRFEDDYSAATVDKDREEQRPQDRDELVRIMAGSGRQTHVRQWIWRGTQFPLKTIIDDGDIRTTTETTHMAVDAEIPRSMFIVPQDYSMKKIQR